MVVVLSHFLTVDNEMRLDDLARKGAVSKAGRLDRIPSHKPEWVDIHQ